MKIRVARPVHCTVQHSAKHHGRFQKFLWEDKKWKIHGKGSICLVSASAEAQWVWPFFGRIFFFQKHKFSRKPSPWRRFGVMAANRLLFRKWHLRHCRLPENLRNLKSPYLSEAPFCLLKSLHLFPQAFLAPPVPNRVSHQSLLPQQGIPHLFVAFCFLTIPFWFFSLCVTQEDGITLIKQLLPPARKGLYPFVDKIHHHAAVAEPTVWVFQISNNQSLRREHWRASRAPPPWRMEIQRLRSSWSGAGLSHQWCLKYHPPPINSNIQPRLMRISDGRTSKVLCSKPASATAVILMGAHSCSLPKDNGGPQGL